MAFTDQNSLFIEHPWSCSFVSLECSLQQCCLGSFFGLWLNFLGGKGALKSLCWAIHKKAYLHRRIAAWHFYKVFIWACLC